MNDLLHYRYFGEGKMPVASSGGQTLTIKPKPRPKPKPKPVLPDISSDVGHAEKPVVSEPTGQQSVQSVAGHPYQPEYLPENIPVKKAENGAVEADKKNNKCYFIWFIVILIIGYLFYKYNKNEGNGKI